MEDKILKNEAAEELWTVINKLTLKSREIIVLHYYSGLKLQEISTILGIPLGTCKSRLNTALTSLEKQLKGYNIMISEKGENVYGTI